MIRIFILSIGRSDTLTNKNLAATVIRRKVMKKLSIEDFKINNGVKKFHREYYESLNDKINKYNKVLQVTGEAPSPEKYKWIKVLQYAMENEVRIDQVHAALLFCSRDMDKAMKFFKK